ncbi:hypothetical protein LP419_00660 [Massilia sp. H-1]|nr:hypothetical protein LP419_00660 [Massilia sp. H-1]
MAAWVAPCWLSSREFVARAARSFRRQGGNVIHRSPYVVAAAMQFDQRLAAMLLPCSAAPSGCMACCATSPALRVNPAQPQANMLHLHLPVGRERALAIRNQLAEEHKIWMFGRASHAALPDSSVVELYVGDNLATLDDDTVRDASGGWTPPSAPKLQSRLITLSFHDAPIPRPHAPC